MKKIIILFWAVVSLIFVNIPVIAIADDTKILDYTRPNGLTQRLTTEISNLPGFDSNMISLKGCAGVLNYLKNTKEPTIALWFWFSNELGGSGEHCQNLNTEDFFITSYAKTYLNICSTNTVNNTDVFRGGNYRLGYPSVYKKEAEILAELLKQLSIENVKLVPYKQAPDVMAALEIGEVSYGIFITPSKEHNCEITLNPRAPKDKLSIYSFSEKQIDPRPLYGNWVVIGANVDKEFVRNSIVTLINSESWQAKFPDFYDATAEVLKDQQLKKVLADLEYIIEFHEQQ
jgi:hypothetical protein